jgi:hypothetical protein
MQTVRHLSILFVRALVLVVFFGVTSVQAQPEGETATRAGDSLSVENDFSGRAAAADGMIGRAVPAGESLLPVGRVQTGARLVGRSFHFRHGRVPGLEPLPAGLEPFPDSTWTGRVDLRPALSPERLSAGQNLLWGTVGLALTLFTESEPAARRAAISRRARGQRNGPRWPSSYRPPPPRRLHRPASPAGCHACDPVERRSMGALVEGLFNLGSYTELK